MPKSERLLNLLILLLVQQQFLSKARIRELMPPYQDATDEAFDRQFERDKDELRAMGVPIETGTHSAYFDDEPGYRIKTDEFELTGVDLTADEAAVVGLATRVWQHAGLAAHTSDAITKLAAAGIEVDRSRLDLGVPAVRVDDPSFDDFWAASLSRTRVRFDYRRSGTGEQSSRRLEPWGVVSYSGRWYVVGHDLDRDEERVFRLSRVVGPVKRVGKGNAFTVPKDADLRSVVERLAPPPPTATATVRVRTGTCLGLRRRATQIDAQTAAQTEPGWDRLTLTYGSDRDLADEILWWGADAVVESPDTVRQLIVDRLQAALESA